MEHAITLSEETYAALQRQAARSHQSPDRLAEDWLKQHLDLERYPELEWREGPGGWRVGIKGTAIDVYTIVGYSRAGYSPQEIAGDPLPRLSLDQVGAALRYYAEYSDEIDRILADTETEAAQTQLKRALGPTAYHRLTGSPPQPGVTREPPADYNPGSSPPDEPD